MEQEPSLKMTLLSDSVFGFAAQTGKIVSIANSRDLSLNDVVLSPSSQYMAILHGEWIAFAHLDGQRSRPVGEPFHIKNFSGSALFLDDSRLLAFCNEGFYEYEITQNLHDSYSYECLTKTAYGNPEVGLCVSKHRSPAALSATTCVVPLRRAGYEKSFLKAFHKESKTWGCADLSFHGIDSDMLISVSSGAYALGDPYTGELDWLYIGEKEKLFDGFSLLCKGMQMISISPRGIMLFVGYGAYRNSGLYAMVNKSPLLIGEVPIASTAIQKIFWNNESSQCLIVLNEKNGSRSYCISGLSAKSSVLHDG
jgi:hypothetical protein